MQFTALKNGGIKLKQIAGIYITTTPVSLQNTPLSGQPTICITSTDDGWDKAYKQWLQGKNPTDSKEWSKGVFCCCNFVLKDSPAGVKAAQEKQDWYEKFLK
jgi:hypothetical protein